MIASPAGTAVVPAGRSAGWRRSTQRRHEPIRRTVNMRSDCGIGKAAEEGVRDLFGELRFGRGELTPHQCAQVACRTLVCTPLQGHYGVAAGWCVVLEGSPPKGSVFIVSRDIENVRPAPVYYVTPDGFRWRRLGGGQVRQLLPFWRQRLRDEELGFELPGVPWPPARTA